MRPFRFVHAADLHIDSPFHAWRVGEPEIAERLRDSTFRAWRNLVDLCISEKAAFLLVAGDVYDGADRGIRAQMRFRDGLRELGEQGIQSFVAHGNHDPLDGWQTPVREIEGVHVFGDSPEWAVARHDGVPVASIQGVSYPTREVHDNLAARFQPPRDPGMFQIGLLHCNVGADPNHPNYAPCSVSDLEAIGLDYWALGHVHTRRTLRGSSPAIVYPGNPQGRHPNETGPRGCVVVDVSEDGTASIQFHPLDVVRWAASEISISGLSTIDDLVEAMQQQLWALRDEADGRDVICRLTLIGRGVLHRDLRRHDAVTDLRQELRDGARAVQPLAWVERIVDLTRPDMDLDTRSRQDDFLGILLERSSQAAGDPALLADIRAELNTLFGRRALRDVLQVPDDGQIVEWIEEARWLLADRLEGEP